MKLINSKWQALLLMNLSKRLATIRKARGLTQQQMSETIGIHLSQVKRDESGDTQPSLDVLRKIAFALSQFSPEEKKVAKELLDSLIIKNTANQPAASNG